MPELIVDFLQPVEIDEQHADGIGIFNFLSRS